LCRPAGLVALNRKRAGFNQPPNKPLQADPPDRDVFANLSYVHTCLDLQLQLCGGRLNGRALGGVPSRLVVLEFQRTFSDDDAVTHSWNEVAVTLPQDLQRVVDAALLSVHNRTDTTAAPDFLLTIGDFFGHLTVNQPQRDRSQQRRIVLTLLTVRHAFPAWEQTWPTDRRPHHFLTSITRTVLYDFRSERVNQLAERVETWLMPYLAQKEEPSRMVGYSLATILDALIAITDGFVIENRTPDQQMTVAVLFAAAAYAQGTFLDATFNPDRWFAFWEIWLGQIVPTVWKELPSTNDGIIIAAG